MGSLPPYKKVGISASFTNPRASPAAEAAKSKARWATPCHHTAGGSPAPLPPHLQDENEVVDGAVALVEVMLGSLLVLTVVLELLDDVGVLEEPQQDLLGEVGGLEGLHFYRGGTTGWLSGARTLWGAGNLPPPELSSPLPTAPAQGRQTQTVLAGQREAWGGPGKQKLVVVVGSSNEDQLRGAWSCCREMQDPEHPLLRIVSHISPGIGYLSP